MHWTWDPAKNRENLRKHGILFEDAIEIFKDPFILINEDPYPYEQRWQATGMVHSIIITVIYTLPTGYPENQTQAGRIISARGATRRERIKYAEA